MKILLVQTGFLGDVVLSTPVLAELARQFPGAKISILTTPLAKPLVELHPNVEKVLVFDKRGKYRGLGGLLRFARRLREERFEKVFSLHKSYRTAALLLLARIPERFGFAEASASFLYSRTATRKEYPHEVLRNLAILKTVGVDPGSLGAKMNIGLSDESIAQAEKLISGFGGPWVAIAPGSVWATKRWTTEGFATVTASLVEQGYSVVILGGPSDEEVARDVEDKCGKKILNLTGRTNLMVSAAIISKCDLVVTNDSAPLHIASAVGTPVVAAFCATVPEFGFGPWGVPSEIVGVENLSCRPCGRHGGNTCPTGTHACQKQLSAEMVLSAAKRVLEQVAKGASCKPQLS